MQGIVAATVVVVLVLCWGERLLVDEVKALHARLQRAEAAAEFCGCPKVD